MRVRHWNYRLVKRVYDDDLPADDLAIHEVYYDEAGEIVAWSADPATPGGEDLDGVRRDLEMFIEALAKPTLNYDDLPKGDE